MGRDASENLAICLYLSDGDYAFTHFQPPAADAAKVQV
jgi:hypothetical protein